MIIKNPRNVKNPSPETVRKHTFECLNCKVVFINLNIFIDKYCSRKCASDYRKSSGWKPSKEHRKKISEAGKGREVSEETRKKLRKDVDEQKLIRLYLEESKTQKECAEIFGCGLSTVSRYLKQYGLVGKKSNHQAQTAGSSNTGQYMDKGWLYQKYFVEKLTTVEIANICSVGRTTIKRWIKKHGFVARDNSESQLGKKMSAEFCDKQSKRVKGKGNPFYGKTHTSETIDKIMEKKMYYPYQGGTVKWYFHTRNDGKEIKLQGTWEFETARYFDSNNEIYLVHGEFDSFSYSTETGIKVYYPDFYLLNKDIYIEVKGYFNDRMKNKLGAVRKEHDVKIEIWQKKDLEEKGILVKGQYKMVAEGYYEQYLIK